MTTLTVVVPCWNSAGYLGRCLDSLVTDAGDVEVLVVNDGSTDGTAVIADEYATRLPGLVRAIHQPNGGHGAAINTGLREAVGRYVKIVDSDDWLDRAAYAELVTTLRGLEPDVDLVVSNFVYENVDRQRRKAVRYRGALPRGRAFGWDETGRFGPAQYLLMHALVYRTALLRECGLRLPVHTFYVDNLYAYLPLTRVRRLYYLDVDLYRYLIGREGQSVQEAVMLRRMDQYLRITRAMIDHLSAARREPEVPAALARYLLHYAGIVCAAASALLVRDGSRESLAANERLWARLRRDEPWLYRRMRRGMLGRLSTLPGRSGRGVTVLAYRAAQWAVGFN